MVASCRWPVRRTRVLFKREQREPRDDEGIVTAFRDGQVTLRSKRREEGFTNAIQEFGYQGVRRGDLVIHSMDGFAGAIGVSDSDGKSSPVVHCYRPNLGVDARYYAYLLRDLALRGFVTSLAKGIRERSTAFDSETFRSLVVPYPALAEQRAIADYLDTETARIDALITKKQRMITLVKARSMLVAEGLATGDLELVSGEDGARPQTLSGLQGAPDSNWSRFPLKSLFDFSKGRDAQRLSREYVSEHPGEFPVFSGQTGGDGIFGSIDTYDFSCASGAILVATVGAEAMKCRLISGRFSLSQNCALMTPRANVQVSLPFVMAHLRRLFVMKRAEIPDHMQPSLRIEDLNRFWIRLPPIDTQIEIGLFIEELDRASGKIAQVMSAQLDLLVERRQALITAAVTGELEIPGVAA